jgi:hypothetical protein
MGEERNEIDWELTTWEGSRRAQLRRALTLTLRQRMQAVKDLADVARRFQELHAQGAFRSVSGSPSEGTQSQDDTSHP